MKNREWISTGEAARRMGYDRDHFREKYKGIITARRFGKGHFQWLASAVDALVEGSQIQNAA